MSLSRVVRCCALGLVFLAILGWSAAAVAGVVVGSATITGDADSGISSSITYTHALDFGNSGAAPTIEGVAFTKAAPTGANWTVTGAGGYAAGTTGSIGVPSGQGTYTLLNDFLYGGNPATVTLTGLMPGTPYNTRIYYRAWGGDRTNRVAFNDGTGTQTVAVNEDADTAAHYLEYKFFAPANGQLVITTNIANTVSGSWHFYGLTNQEETLPPFWTGLSNSDWGNAGNWAPATVPDGVGATAGFGAADTAGTIDLGNVWRTIGTALFQGDVGTTITSNNGYSLTMDNGNGGTSGTAPASLIVTGGAHTIAAPMALNSNTTVHVDGSGDSMTISGAIADGSNGPRGLTKSGAGLLTLAEFNTYSGGTTLNAGVLAVSDDANLGDSFGTLTFMGGTLRTTAGITSTRPVTVSVLGGTFDSNGCDSSIAGTIVSNANGTGGLTKIGAGTLAIASANPGYTGPTAINAGVLRVDNPDALQQSTVSVNVDGGLGFGTFVTTATLGALTGNRGFALTNSDTDPVALSVGANNAGTTYSGSMSGDGSLIKIGTGQLLLASANTYTGGTAINAGALRIDNPGALGSGPVSISNGANLLLWWNTGSKTVPNDFTLNAPGTVDGKAAIYADGGNAGYAEYILSGTITLAGNSNLSGNTANTLKVTGQVTGSGGLTKGGARTDESGVLILANPANDYMGNTTVNKGTLRLGASEVIPHGTGMGNVAVNTTLDLGGNNETINGLTGSGTITNARATPGMNTLTVGAADATSTFSGSIQNGSLGTTALTKIGSGTLTLVAPSNYTGPTNIDGGTVQLIPGVPTGYALHYGFDSGAAVNDGAGGANNGALVGTAAIVAGGRSGEGMMLNIPSQTGVLNLASAVSLSSPTSGTWTASVWFNTPYASSVYRTLLRGNNSNGTGDHPIISPSGSNNLGWFNNSSGTTGGAGSGFNNAATNAMLNYTSGWHQVTAVGKGTSTDFYVDGVLLGTAPGASIRNIAYIGNYQDGGQAFAQYVDDVYIYQSALTPAQVAQLYNGIGAGGSLPSTSAVSLSNAATLDLNGTNQTIGSLTSADTATRVTLGSGTLTVGADGTSPPAFAGVISGSGGLVKTGGGVMTLSNANTYTGPTTVNGGVLVLSGASGAIADSSAYNVGPGTLRLDNTAANATRLKTTSPITLNGGTIELIGNATAPTVQTFGTVSQGMGDSAVVFSGSGGPHVANAIPGARATGGTLNVVGSDANHKLVLTGLPDNYGFLGAGYFAGGSDFAWYAAGVARPINYGTDPNSVTQGNVAFTADTYTRLTAPRTGQDTANLRTLNLSGSGVGVALNAGQLLSLGEGGLIKSGGGSPATISGGLMLSTAASELVVRTDTAADSLTISTPIVGAATLTLTKSGAGMLSLANAGNNYGGTVLTGGTLNFVNGSLPAGANKITFAGGALQWAAGNTQDISAGMAAIPAGQAARLDTNGNNVTLASPLGGSGGLTKLGAGTLALTATNTYAGSTTLNAGVLSFANGAIPVGANKIVFGGGTLQWAAGNTQDISGSLAAIAAGQVAILNTNGNTVTLASPVRGSGGLTKDGAGTLVLANDSPYTGVTTINAGTLQFGNGGAAGAVFSSGILNNGTLGFNQSVNFEYAGIISGTGNVVKSGAGTLTLVAANGYSGGTTINGGTLSVASHANLGGPNTPITFSAPLGGDAGRVPQGGVLQITGAAISNLDSHAVNWNGFSGGFDIADAAHTFTVSQAITGAGGLLKYGPGTLVLGGANAFTGRSKIYAGTVRITTDGGLGIGGHDGNTMSEIYDGAALELEGDIASPEHFHFWGSGPQGKGSIRSLSGDNALTNGPGYCLRSDGRIGVDSGSLRITQLYETGGVSVQLEKVGAGTLIFDGEATNNGYGRTLISEGTLQIGNGGTTGSLRAGAPIANNATLAFSHSNDISFNNPISGSGGVWQIGAGTVALSGVNTYTGGTAIDSGVLRFDAVASIPASGVISVNFGGTAAASPEWFGAMLDKVAADSAGTAALTADSIEDLDFSGFAHLSLGAVGGANFTHALTPNAATYRLGGGGGTLVYFPAIGGANSLVVCGSGSGGVVVLASGGNTFTGATRIEGGALRGPAGLSPNSNLVIDGGALEYVGGGVYSPVPGTGAGQVQIPGGTSGFSAVGGDLLVDFGGGAVAWGDGHFRPEALILNQPSADSSIAFQNNLDLKGATRTVLVNSASAVTATLGGVISNSVAGSPAGLTKGGPGTLVLASPNTYNGDTTVNAGTLVQGAVGAIPSGAQKGNVAIAAAATLDLGGLDTSINGLSGAGTVINTSPWLSTNTLTVGGNNANGTFSGVIQDSINGGIALVKTGAGTQTLSGTSTYTGGTTIAGGILSISSDRSLGAVPGFAAENVTFTGNATLQAADPVILAATRDVNISAATVTLDTQDNGMSVLGVISGNGGNLVKTGNGALVLQGTNTYTGTTSIQAGTLKVLGVPAGVVAHYTFNDGTAKDDVSGLDGTLAAGVTSAAGIIGGALNFPGNGTSHVSVPYNAAFNQTSFTVSAWVNVADRNGVYGILGTRVGGDATFDFKVMSSTFAAPLTNAIHGDVGNGSGWISTGVDILVGETGSNGQGPDFAPGAWHMITYVADPATSQFNLYLDGDLKKTMFFTGTPLLMKPGQTLFIGDTYSGDGGVTGTEPMKGSIDDVFIYGRALSAEDVTLLYQRATGGVPTQAIPSGSPVTVAADATLDMSDAMMSIGSLAGGGDVLLGSGTLTAGSDNSSTIFSGSLAGAAGSLVKEGSGKLTLSGPNTHGSTTVTAGTLEITHADGLPAGSALTIGAGGTVVLGQGVTTGAVASAAASQAAAVPEPGTLGLLAVAVAVMLMGAWRRR